MKQTSPAKVFLYGWLGLSSLVTFCSIAFGQTVGPDVYRALEAGASARVVLALRHPGPPPAELSQMKLEIGTVREKVLSRLGPADFIPTHRWDGISAIAGEVSAPGLAKLMADPDVLRVDLDVGGGANLRRSVPLVRADRVQSLGFTGKGVVVAVIDSGIWADHPDLRDDLIAEQCFCANADRTGCCPNGAPEQSGPGAAADGQGHGTNVAGIITSDGHVAPVGVAPAAKIVAVRVLDRSGRFTSTTQVLSALDWIINRRPDVKVINMSLGTDALYGGACDDAAAYTLAFASAINTLRARGVTVFASAGNEGSTTQLAVPACISSTVAVGAVFSANFGPISFQSCHDDATAADQVTCFSNSGTGLSLLAPGALITSTGLSGPTSTFAGTSQASPHAAGLAALLLEANPSLTPDQIVRAMKSTGVSVTDARNGLTFPRIDALAAIQQVVSQSHFAQFANGAGYVSSLVFTNPSRTGAASGTLSFFSDNGQPLAVSVNGQPPAVTVPFRISPLGEAAFVTNGAGDLGVGSVRVNADIPVAGVVKFSIPGLGIAGVGESLPLSAFMTPVVRNDARRLNTGLAIRNILAQDVTLMLSLRSLEGREVPGGASSEHLPANGHLAKFLDALFPMALTTNFQGTLVVTVATPGGAVAATALQIGAQSGEFTTLPVVAVDPTPTDRSLYFAQFANGAGYTSSLFLTNPTTSAVSGEITFFDDGGNRLALALNGQAPSDRVAFAIAPQGGAVFTTDGQGSLISGSARVRAGGPIGGVLRFSIPNLGIAGVGAGAAASGFIAPVLRNLTLGLNTGVAVTSLGSAVTLNLTLRNARGEAVTGGQTTLPLAPNGHWARFLEDLFPGADLRDFEGTLTVTADGGPVAGTAIQIGSRSGEFTTLPVTLLR